MARSEEQKRHLTTLAEKQKHYVDMHTKPLPPLIPGEQVNVWNSGKSSWAPAQVVEKHSDRSYVVEVKNGRLLRRNRKQVRPHYPRYPSRSPQSQPYAMAVIRVERLDQQLF